MKHKWIWIIMRRGGPQRFYSTGLSWGSFCTPFTSYSAAYKVLSGERFRCRQQANEMFEIQKPETTAYDFWVEEANSLKIVRVSLSERVTDEDLAAIAKQKKRRAA